MKRLSFALLAVIVSVAVLFSAVQAVALSSSDLSESDKTAALAEAERLWGSRTNEGNITFRLTPEGILWTIAANQKNGFNLYAEGIEERIYMYVESEPIPLEEAIASDKIPQSWKDKILEDIAKIVKKSEEKAAAAGVQNDKSDVDKKSIIDTRSDEEKFAGDEYKNALPAPRPPGFESEESSEETDKDSGLAAAQGTQANGKTVNSAQSGTESAGNSPNAAAATSSEAASLPTASSSKEPGEAKKDKSGEKKELFFAKVLKWLFGK